jgi:hypothetical protein
MIVCVPCTGLRGLRDPQEQGGWAILCDINSHDHLLAIFCSKASLAAAPKSGEPDVAMCWQLCTEAVVFRCGC